MTALMRAAQHGHLEVVKVLVANDSILDIKCKVCISVQLVLYKYVLYTKVVMLLVSIYALKFHLHISVFPAEEKNSPHVCSTRRRAQRGGQRTLHSRSKCVH